MWTQLPQQQHQAFEDASITIEPGSTNGPGQVTIADHDVTALTLNTAAGMGGPYFNADQTSRPGAQKTKEALIAAIRNGESANAGRSQQTGIVLHRLSRTVNDVRSLRVDNADPPQFSVV